MMSNAGGLPGTVLTSSDPLTSVPSENVGDTVLEADFDGTFTLAPNTTYWLAGLEQGTVVDLWGFNPIGDVDIARHIDAWSLENGASIPGFAVNGTPEVTGGAVPLPATAWGGLVLLVGFGAFKQVRRYFMSESLPMA